MPGAAQPPCHPGSGWGQALLRCKALPDERQCKLLLSSFTNNCLLASQHHSSITVQWWRGVSLGASVPSQYGGPAHRRALAPLFVRRVACSIVADAGPCAAADFPRRNADEEEERERARAWAERPPAPPALQVAFLLPSSSGLLVNIIGTDRCVLAVA